MRLDNGALGQNTVSIGVYETLSKFSNWFNGGRAEDDNQGRGGFDGMRQPRFDPLNDSRQPQYRDFSAPQAPAQPKRSYSSVFVYQPRSAEDVQVLINYLKKREPAIINLDGVDEEVAQRILDFISGAIYALFGSVHRISGNIFLLTPEGVDISIPYDN